MAAVILSAGIGTIFLVWYSTGPIPVKNSSLASQSTNARQVRPVKDPIPHESWTDELVPEMVFVQSGPFITRPDPSKNIPPYETSVSSFFIGKYEVTMREFYAFCRDTGYYESRYSSVEGPLARTPWGEVLARMALDDSQSVESLRPKDWAVFDVAWVDAMAYCLWLGEKTGKPFRLPTQAEWEYACTSRGLEWMESVPNLESVAVFADTRPHAGRTYLYFSPVGQKLPNLLGLHDILGNVWEWCLEGPDISSGDALRAFRALPPLSWSDMLKTSVELDRISPALFSTRHALRGGALVEPKERTSPVFRMYYGLGHSEERFGFRVAYSNETADQLAEPNTKETAHVVSHGLTLPELMPDPQDEIDKQQEERAKAVPISRRELDELMKQYSQLLGKSFDQFPVLAWRDELMELELYSDSTLQQRKDDQKLRDELTPDGREEFFRLRNLAIKSHLRNYTGEEPEIALAFSRRFEGLEDQDAVDSVFEPLREEAGQTYQEMQEAIAASSLPEVLVWRAQVDGELEARRSLLEAALSTVEPVEAESLGYRIQVLRSGAGLSTSRSWVLQQFLSTK
jgi:formylglycine-generating enzyme required for sulfatase activity